MKILFSHVNYPSQFRRIIPYLVSLGHDIVFLCRNFEWHATSQSGLRIIRYKLSRPSDSLYCHPYLRRFESYSRARQFSCGRWPKQECSRDVVVGHVGFGNGFYLKDCFPDALRVSLVEWFCNKILMLILSNHPLSIDQICAYALGMLKLF